MQPWGDPPFPPKQKKGHSFDAPGHVVNVQQNQGCPNFPYCMQRDVAGRCPHHLRIISTRYGGQQRRVNYYIYNIPARKAMHSCSLVCISNPGARCNNLGPCHLSHCTNGNQTPASAKRPSPLTYTHHHFISNAIACFRATIQRRSASRMIFKP